MTRGFNDDGLILAKSMAELKRTGAKSPTEIGNPQLEGLLNQLSEAGEAQELGDTWRILWDCLYSMVLDPECSMEARILAIPSWTDLAPSLRSHGALSDADFAVWIDGWRNHEGHIVDIDSQFGAVISIRGEPLALLSKPVWNLCQRTEAFRARPVSERNDGAQRRAWGEIRQLALRANAHLDNFLSNTIVLTPKTLALRMRRNETALGKIGEILPEFEGAPSQWLTVFDSKATVRDRYDMSTPGGIVQVIIEPAVKAVLQQLKRMPGRKVSGSRAEAFLLNPFATLGELAREVLDEAQLEAARTEARIVFEAFTPLIERDSGGGLSAVGILVHSNGQDDGKRELFETTEDLSQFVKALRQRAAKGLHLLGWRGYEFELTGDSPDILAQLESTLQEMLRPPLLIDYQFVFSLEHYCPRVIGIGKEEPYLSPYIAKMDQARGWFPENVIPFLHIRDTDSTTGQNVQVTPELLTSIRNGIADATRTGADEIVITGLAKPIPISEAERILRVFDGALSDVKKGTFSPEKQTPSAERQSLIVEPNIDRLEYVEAAAPIPAFESDTPALPAGLLTTISLKKHQLEGVARLQRLFQMSPKKCRGVILADDMGLGKTLQLLTLIAWAFETEPKMAPALIVAPVSLLENWEEEICKFFQPNYITSRTIYGDSLKAWRVPKESIDAQLLEEGLVKFLRPGWADGTRIVLTTYETLRDLEFSFAERAWSIMVCDEAQKIKNPNALVTRAAKKQNVRFRVACTGTPVENSLVDLWCLFDFIQPGYLGALSKFGQLYRRPIEARTEEQKQRVEELRALIAPQVIRRTKVEVLEDLPQKIEHHPLVPISEFQRNLYANAIDSFRNRKGDSNAPFQHHLGLLQYLRWICTDPGGNSHGDLMELTAEEYQLIAPKMGWVLGILGAIKASGEKAIVFCEFRAIQRLLRFYIEGALRFSPDIINGETETNRSSPESRHKKLRRFQMAPGFGVIILSPVAVGFGINVQAANHVIHYTRTWNPAKEDQATDRAYRIGQEKDVMVYYPILHADEFATFDVRLNELLTIKRELAKDMLNGTGEIDAAEFGLDAPSSCDAHP